MEKIVSVWRMVTTALSSMCVRRNMAGKKLGTAVVFRYATIRETGCQTWSLTYIFLIVLQIVEHGKILLKFEYK